MPKNTKRTADRIIARVEVARPISAALLASDLHLTTDTVKRHVRTLVAEGRLEYDADGMGLDLTNAERAERAIDRRVATHR